MRPIIIVLAILCLALPGLALTTTPEAQTMLPGSSSSPAYDNFGVAGESAAGLIYSGSYSGSVGLASMIFTPLFPQAGSAIATVTTLEGDAVAYPNPFVPVGQPVTIAYKYSTDRPVKAYIFDLSGRLIRLLVDNSANRGSDGLSRVVWDGKSALDEKVENGVYFVRIVADGKTIGKTKVLAIQ